MSQNAYQNCSSLHSKTEGLCAVDESRIRECISCHFAIVSDVKCVRTVRKSSLSRLKFFLNHIDPCTCFPDLYSALPTLINLFVTTLQRSCREKCEFKGDILNLVVESSFRIDIACAQKIQLEESVCDGLLKVCIQRIVCGVIVENSDFELLLLAKLLEEYHLRNSRTVDITRFAFFFNRAIACNELLVFEWATDILLSKATVNHPELSNSATVIASAVISAVCFDIQSALQKICSKLAVLFHVAQTYTQQGNSITLAINVLDGIHLACSSESRDKKCAGDYSAGPICVREPGQLKLLVFSLLNEKNVLIRILKLSVLSPARNVQLCSGTLILKVCSESFAVSQHLVNEGMLEYLFEALSRFGGCQPSSIEQEALKIFDVLLQALEAIAKAETPSLESKWEFGVECLLNAMPLYFDERIAFRGFRCLRKALKSGASSSVTKANIDSVLEYVRELGARLERQNALQNHAYSDELHGENREQSLYLYGQGLQCLLHIYESRELALDSMTVLCDICETSVELCPELEESRKLLLLLLRSSVDFDSSELQEMDGIVKMRARLFDMVYTKVGPQAANVFAEFASGSACSYMAETALAYVELLEFLFNGRLKPLELPVFEMKNVWKWLWQTISPMRIFSFVESVESSAAEVNESSGNTTRTLRDIARRYLLGLIGDDSSLFRKMDFKSIPCTVSEFDATLLNFENPIEVNYSIHLLRVCVDIFGEEAGLLWKERTLELLAQRLLHSTKSSIIGERLAEVLICIRIFLRLSRALNEGREKEFLPSQIWPVIVQQNEFCPSSDPDIFCYVISKLGNSPASRIAWGKYALGLGQESAERVHLEELVQHHVQSESTCIDTLCDAVISFETANRIYDVAINIGEIRALVDGYFIQAFSNCGICDSVLEDIQQYEVYVRIDTTKHVPNDRETIEKRNTSSARITGLLDIISNWIDDFDTKFIQKLTLVVCDLFQKVEHGNLRTNSSLLLAVLRYLCRLFKTPYNESLEVCRQYATRPSILQKVAMILKTRSDVMSSSTDFSNDFLTAAAACLLTMNINFLSQRSMRDHFIKCFDFLPQSTRAWAFLVSTFSIPDYKGHAETCRAVNCISLLRLLARETPFMEILSDPIVIVALSSSAVSQTLALSDSSLDCLLAGLDIYPCCESQGSIAVASALMMYVRGLLVHGTRKPRQLELFYFIECVRRGLVDVGDSELTEAIFSSDGGEEGSRDSKPKNDEYALLKIAYKIERQKAGITDDTNGNETMKIELFQEFAKPDGCSRDTNLHDRWIENLCAVSPTVLYGRQAVLCFRTTKLDCSSTI